MSLMVVSQLNVKTFNGLITIESDKVYLTKDLMMISLERRGKFSRVFFWSFIVPENFGHSTLSRERVKSFPLYSNKTF